MHAHKGGQWFMRYRGRDYYFGPVSDPERALREWRRRWPRIVSGQDDSLPSSDSTVLELLNAWMDRQQARLDAGKLAATTFRSYRTSFRWAVATLGRGRRASHLTLDDWYRLLDSLSGLSLTTQDDRITHFRAMHRFARDQMKVELAELPSDFRRASKRQHRARRRKAGDQSLTAAEARALIEAAGPKMRAIVLVMLNGGYRQSDLAEVPLSALDRSVPEIVHARRKTETFQRVPLWPETMSAIDAAEAAGAMRAAGSELLFTSNSGRPLAHHRVSTSTDVVLQRFRRLAARSGVSATPSSLRHTFLTVAFETADDTARKIIAGHTIDNMDEVYVRRYPLERLRAVTEHVRSWLWA